MSSPAVRLALSPAGQVLSQRPLPGLIFLVKDLPAAGTLRASPEGPPEGLWRRKTRNSRGTSTLALSPTWGTRQVGAPLQPGSPNPIQLCPRGG